MAYYNPHITGFSTFDLSARETSCTADQHLHDSRALQRNRSKKHVKHLQTTAGQIVKLRFGNGRRGADVVFRLPSG